MVKEYREHSSSLEWEESSSKRKDEQKDRRRRHHRHHKHRHHHQKTDETGEASVEVSRKRRKPLENEDRPKRTRNQDNSSSEDERPVKSRQTQDNSSSEDERLVKRRQNQENSSSEEEQQQVRRRRKQENSLSEDERPQRRVKEESRQRKEQIGRRNGKDTWRRNRHEEDDSRPQSTNNRWKGGRQRNKQRREPTFDPNRPIKQEPVSDEESKWGRPAAGGAESATSKSQEKQKPNFGLSGSLAKDTNTFNGVVIKYSEPPEARKPRIRWRLYVFKGQETLPTLYVHRQSAYLMGRDRKVVDIPIDHPSCSKQHAALQYRLVKGETAAGRKVRKCKPYIIDLESANGTYVNNNRIEARRYVELLEKDVVKFGYSSREYVLLHEHSKGPVEEEEAESGNESQ